MSVNRIHKLLGRIRRHGAFIVSFVYPKNISKGYKILRRGGLGEFRRRLRSKLHYQYIEQRYQYRDYLKVTRPTQQELKQQTLFKFEYQPCFGIAIPLYNTKAEYLEDLLESFKAQTYGNFKLFMVDASPHRQGKTQLTERIKQLAVEDSRIIYSILDKNEGIAGNTNKAINLAMQDSDITHIGLCDHDDFLEPDALYQYAKVLNTNKDIKIIYSDEDVVAFKDDPNAFYVMKPDFNEFLMESCNYINHFFVCEKKLLKKVQTSDGLYEQPEYDGAQDYDLYLRLIEEALKLDDKLQVQESTKVKDALYTSSTIYHVPKVLYHWRAGDGSTAQDPHNKLYAFDAGKHALEEYFKRRSIDIQSIDHTKVLGTYRIRYQNKHEPLVSVIIPNKDHIEDLRRTVESVESGTYKNLEFIIVENNSVAPETFAYYKKIKKAKNIKVVTYDGEFNYSKINNFGVKYASGEILLLLNNDIEMINKDSIVEMVAIIERDRVGAVGAQLVYSNQELQHAGVIIGLGGSAGHIFHHIRPEFSYSNRANCVTNYSAVTAACLMVKKNTYLEVGGFNEDFAVSFNDVDFCLRIRSLGKLIVYTPYAKFYHYESKSRGADTTPEKRERMEHEAQQLRESWPNLYQNGDPYYNPNLTCHRSDCSLREMQPSDFR